MKNTVEDFMPFIGESICNKFGRIIGHVADVTTVINYYHREEIHLVLDTGDHIDVSFKKLVP